jgi:hypothetical protein
LSTCIRQEQDGRLDVLVNDTGGGDSLTQWGVPFWQHSLENGLTLIKAQPDWETYVRHTLGIERG